MKFQLANYSNKFVQLFDLIQFLTSKYAYNKYTMDDIRYMPIQKIERIVTGNDLMTNDKN